MPLRGIRQESKSNLLNLYLLSGKAHIVLPVTVYYLCSVSVNKTYPESSTGRASAPGAASRTYQHLHKCPGVISVGSPEGSRGTAQDAHPLTQFDFQPHLATVCHTGPRRCCLTNLKILHKCNTWEKQLRDI